MSPLRGRDDGAGEGVGHRRRGFLANLRWWLIATLPVGALLGPHLGVGPVFAFRLTVVALAVLSVLTTRPTRGSRAVVVGAVWIGSVVVGWLTHLSGPGRSLPDLAGAGLLLVGVWVFTREPVGPGAERPGVVRLVPVAALSLGWGLAIAVSMPVAVWEIATGRHLHGYIDGTWRNHPGVYRAPATWLTNPNMYAVFLAVGCPLLGWQARRARGIRRAAMALVALIGLGLLLATGGRAATAAVAVMVVSVALGQRRTRWWTLAVLVVLLGAVVVTQYDSLALSWHRFVGVLLRHSNEGPSSFSVRSALLAWGVALVGAHPLFGVGPGGYRRAIMADPRRWSTHGKVDPHNGVVEIASQYGLVVLALVAALWIAAVVRVLRHGDQVWPRDGLERAWVVGFLLSMPVLALANSTYVVQSVTQLVWALAAALVWNGSPGEPPVMAPKPQAGKAKR